MEKLELGFLEEIDAGSDEEMPDDPVECGGLGGGHGGCVE